MQFVMIKEFSWDLSKDKVIIGKNKDENISIAYLLVIADFDQDYDFNIIRNTESVQIRPKAIYKNDKGYYKKVDGKREYFNEDRVEEIEQAIEKFKKYLEEVEKDESI